MPIVKLPSRKVLMRTATVSILAASISISVSTGFRMAVGAQSDTITIVVRLVLPFIIAVPLALIWFTQLERLENSYLALLSRANELARIASIDPLTGLLNRRSFREQVELALDHRVPGYFLVADVDYLKTINDVYGHPAGDEAILAIGSALRDALGDESLIARIGGDEFCAFVPLVDGAGRESWADVIGESATRRFRERTGLSAERLSITVGAIPCPAGMTFDKTLAEADSVLYSRKRLRRATAQAVFRERVSGASEASRKTAG